LEQWASRFCLGRVATESFTVHNEIGPVVLAGLSAIFAGYGIRELALAYKAAELKEWSERAALG
jgi:hypothetical protein